MKILSRVFLPFLLLCLLNLAGCGGKEQTERVDFSYNLSALAAGVSQLEGGIFLRANRIDPDTGEILETLDVDLLDNAADIPFGTWEFYLLGYAGPEAWSGNLFCGSVPETLLDSAEISLSVTLNTTNCANAPYGDMDLTKQASIAGTWDASLWGEAKWAP